MREPHLLSVGCSPGDLSELLKALGEAGLRFGWLRLDAEIEPPAELAGPVEQGALRAVAVGQGRSLALKQLSGPPVTRDLLRQHFLGCAVVLVEGGSGLPSLERLTEGWRIVDPAMADRRLTTEELMKALRSGRRIAGDGGRR